MKKAIAAVIILVIIIAAAWLILLRPSDYTEEETVSFFGSKKDSFAVMAEYLTEYNVYTTIEGFLSVDERYGVPVKNENRYRAFNDANTVIMREKVGKIVSSGDRVEFILLDEGGLLSRQDVRIIYSPEKPDYPSAKPLGEKNWYLCMEKR